MNRPATNDIRLARDIEPIIKRFDNFDVWKVLPPTKRVALLGIRRRIERLTTSRNPHLRARAYMALAWLEYEFHDVAPAQPQSHLRQALMAEPDLTEAELLSHRRLWRLQGEPTGADRSADPSGLEAGAG